jgi:predicted nucleic acid-binding protein
MNGTSKISFDTCAVAKLLKREYDLASLGIDVDEVEQYVSVIARMELLAKQGLPSEEEREIREFLAQATVVPIDTDVETEAIAIRRDRKLRLPDAIIAATSVILNTTLLTDDDHLLKLSWPGYTARPIL